MRNSWVITMGLKSSALILATGAALATYAIPEARQSVSRRIDSTLEIISNLFYSIDPSIRSKTNSDGSSPLRPSKQPYFEGLPQLERSDGTKMEPWNYRGNEWPSEWPKFNEDGSFNRDYVDWHMRKTG